MTREGAELNGRRIALRPSAASDLVALHTLWNDEEVGRFLFDGEVVSREEAERLLVASVSSFASHTYGLWLAYERHTGGLIGFAGLIESESAVPNLVVGIIPQRWREGFGAEAASLVLEHAFALGLSEIRADVDEPNVASVRLLERLGFVFDRRDVVRERPLLYYHLSSNRRAAQQIG